MTHVRFIGTDGTIREVDAAPGARLLEVAQADGQPLEGTCEGQMACSTCHVIVDPQWSGEVGLSGADEEEMLAMNPEREPTSRLSCQMVASEAWDGLIVRTPEFQL